MKKTIYKVLCLALCGIILSNTSVSAKTIDAEKYNNRVVKSCIIDKTGKQITEYYDVNYLPELSL